MRKLGFAIFFLTLSSVLLSPALAQDVTERIAQTNKGTVGIISGGVDGTYIRIASDLASVLDEGNDLRVLAIRGKGSVQNIEDIMYLKGIDIGIVQSDVLEFSRRQKLHHPRIDEYVSYITKLYNEEFHVLARQEIDNIEKLAGKKVNFGIPGSGTEMSASIVFDNLGIDVEKTSFDQALALEKLKSGEIAAQVYVAGKPTRLFNETTLNDGVHFVPIPFTPALLETYLPSKITDEDYPQLVQSGTSVPTLAVGAVMAVYNWQRDTERYWKVTHFINAFFGRFEEFAMPPRHPKWKEVNLHAEVPGWQRFTSAEEWLAARTGVTVEAQGN